MTCPCLRTWFSVGITIALAACSQTTPVANQPSPVLDSAQAPATQQPSSHSSSFNADIYLMAYPDVAQQIKAGKFKSALEHYEKVGKSGKSKEGEAIGGFFTGTEKNDVVQGFGQAPHLSGVGLEVVSGAKGPLPMRPRTLGVGEIDTLVATKGSENEILLGSFKTEVNPKAQPFYVGKGDADYAQIQNFTPGKDALILAGEPSQYKIELKGSNTRISTKNGDLVAIVEGVKQLKVGEIVKEYGIFTLK